MSKYAYVTNTDSNNVSIVDLQTFEEVKRIDIGDSPRGAMAIDKKRSKGFISNCAGNTISVINLLTEEEVKIEVGLAPRGVEISTNNDYLFVANSGESTVSIVDLENLKEVHKIKVGRNPRQISISYDNKYVYVPNFGSDSITIIEIDYDNILNSKAVDEIFLAKEAMPYHVYPDETGKLLFTANTFNHTISVIDSELKKVIKTINVGYNPRAVITEPSGKYLLVSCEASNCISVINRTNWQEIKRIPVGATPRGLVVDTTNNTLLVSCFQRIVLLNESAASRDKMTLISLDTLTRIGNLPTGVGACSVNIVNSEEIFEGHLLEEKYKKDKDYLKGNNLEIC